MQTGATGSTVRNNPHEYGYQDICQHSLFFSITKMFLLYSFIRVLESWKMKYRLEEEKSLEEVSLTLSKYIW